MNKFIYILVEFLHLFIFFFVAGHTYIPLCSSAKKLELLSLAICANIFFFLYKEAKLQISGDNWVIYNFNFPSELFWVYDSKHFFAFLQLALLIFDDHVISERCHAVQTECCSCYGSYKDKYLNLGTKRSESKTKSKNKKQKKSNKKSVLEV